MFTFVLNQSTVNPVNNDHSRLWTSGRCSEVIYTILIQNGPTKGGHYSVVVVNSGLTVSLNEGGRVIT
jgi:hypothetical protein